MSETRNYLFKEAHNFNKLLLQLQAELCINLKGRGALAVRLSMRALYYSNNSIMKVVIILDDLRESLHS